MQIKSGFKIDDNGWKEIIGSRFTKVGVFDYLGSQIDFDGVLGLEPNKIYKVFRPPESLQDEETINSLRLIPLIDEHAMLGDKGIPAEQKGVEGITGEDIFFDGIYLRGNLKILSKDLSTKIEAGKKEISMGYTCDFIPQCGTYDGQQYQFIQKNVKANHLALVHQGRSGSDVAILDNKFIFDEVISMEVKKEENKSELTLESLAKSIATLAEQMGVLKESLSKIESKETGAKDEDVVSEEGAMDEDEKDKEVKDSEKKEDKSEEKKDSEKKQEVMDSKIKKLTKEMQELSKNNFKKLTLELIQRNDLVDKLSVTEVGVFDHAAMTLDEVAVYGVKKLKLKCQVGHELTALNAYFAGKNANIGRIATFDAGVFNNSVDDLDPVVSKYINGGNA